MLQRGVLTMTHRRCLQRWFEIALWGWFWGILGGNCQEFILHWNEGKWCVGQLGSQWSTAIESCLQVRMVWIFWVSLKALLWSNVLAGLQCCNVLLESRVKYVARKTSSRSSRSLLVAGVGSSPLDGCEVLKVWNQSIHWNVPNRLTWLWVH